MPEFAEVFPVQDRKPDGTLEALSDMVNQESLHCAALAARIYDGCDEVLERCGGISTSASVNW